jgi:hypothetical protein
MVVPSFRNQHLARNHDKGQKRIMEKISALDDPDYAAFAWARFRKLMGWMFGVSIIAALSLLTYIHYSVADVPILIMVMIFVGMMVTLLLMAALMGLVFLSSGSGHDEAVMDFAETHE